MGKVIQFMSSELRSRKVYGKVEGYMAVVKEGDIISIDIPSRKLDLKIPEEEIQKRLEKWKVPEPKVKKGVLGTYSNIVKPASKGAVFLF